MTTESPHVVAVTAHRSHEVADPLRVVDGTVEVVDIDASQGFVKRNLETVRRMLRVTDGSSPDVVLSDSTGLLGFLVALCSFVRGTPFVFRFKGDHWRGVRELYRPERGDGVSRRLRYHLTGLLNEGIYAVACGSIVVSEELKTVVVDRTALRPAQVRVVHVPLVPNRDGGSAQRARERFSIRERTVLLTVTNLGYRGKYEGVCTVVRGLESVLEANDDVTYLVAGGGPYLADLRRVLSESVADPSVRARLRAVGFVDDVADLYALADVFIYVSHIDGYPRVVLEAQQSALPVVVNAAHGMVEQVEDGETGLVLEAATGEHVARVVSRLLADPDERVRLGENARKRVQRENDPAVIGAQLVTALADILAERSR